MTANLVGKRVHTDDMPYVEQSDLSLKMIEGIQDCYAIIKNREDATRISHKEIMVTKVLTMDLLESRLRIAIFDLRNNLKITNFKLV